MAVKKLPDGTFQVGDMTFATADQAFEYDNLRSTGTQVDSASSATASERAPAYQMPSKPVTSRMSLWWLVIIIPAALFALMLLIGSMSGPPDEKSNARAAIKLCWGEQQRKSLAPDAQRFVAGACEMMEEKFKAKYGSRP